MTALIVYNSEHETVAKSGLFVIFYCLPALFYLITTFLEGIKKTQNMSFSDEMQWSSWRHASFDS